MPTRLFFELDSKKKDIIEQAAISEFSNFGYIGSSTNSIVKNAGISKGSLFKYFENKEELYFYILDQVAVEFLSSLKKQISDLPGNLFERIIKYSELEFAWYIQNPQKCKLLIKAFAKNDTEIYLATEARYNITAQDIYYSLLEEIDSKAFQWDKQKTLEIMKWFLMGFNEKYISLALKETTLPIDEIKKQYMESLTDFMEILKSGLANGK